MTDLITAYSYLNGSRRDDRAKLFLEQSHSEGQWPQIAFHRFKLHARQHPEGQHWTGYTENPQNCHLWGFSGHGCPDPAMATALRRWRDHWRSVPITASLILSACLERELWLKYFYPVYGSNVPWVHQKNFLPSGDPTVPCQRCTRVLRQDCIAVHSFRPHGPLLGQLQFMQIA